MFARLTAYQRLERIFAGWSRRQAALSDTDYAMARTDGDAPGDRALLRAARAEAECSAMIATRRVERLIAEARQRAGRLSVEQQANLREMDHLARRARAVPADMLADYLYATRKAEREWRDWSEAEDDSDQRQNLRDVVARTRVLAATKGKALGLSPYDAMLEGWDPAGPRAAELAAWADRIEAVMPRLIAARMARQKAAGDPLPVPGAGATPEAQKQLAESLARRMGFALGPEGIAEGSFPQAIGRGAGTRLLMCYPQGDVFSALTAAHELGHGLYARALPRRWDDQPAGDSCGYGIDEGVAHLMDLVVCRRPEFWQGLAHEFRAAFGGSGPAWSADNLARLARRIDPTVTEFDCDELTHACHIAARFRIERDLVEGRQEVDGLPARWTAEITRLTGVAPDPALPHPWTFEPYWSEGWFGNYPSYLVGHVAANQMWQAALRDVPGIPAALAQGDFKPLTGWLEDRIFRHGALLTSRELILRATGKPLDLEALLERLAQDYCGQSLAAILAPPPAAPKSPAPKAA